MLVDLGERQGSRHYNISSVKPALFPSSYQSESSKIFFTEIINKGDPREKLFEDAKRKEIEELINRGTFKIVLQEDLPENANIIPSRFVLAIKNGENNKEVHKARFVLGGHRDKEKRTIVHNSTTLKQSSIRILLAMASIFGFKIWSTDIKQAYLQSASKLKRDVFIKPNIMELNHGELLQFINALYGLTDAGDYWGEKLHSHHVKDLRMKHTTVDFSLFFKHIGNKLVGMSGSYVDDIIRCGTNKFEQSSQHMTASIFDTKKPERNSFTFTGLQVKDGNYSKSLSQSEFIGRLELLKPDCSFEDFRSTRAKLNWLTNTRPDIAFSVSRSSAVTSNTFQSNHIRDINRVIKHLKKTKYRSLRFPKLDQDSLRITTHSDASFSNNDDNSSQIRFIILLSDATNNCAILRYSSYKSRRIARSSMAAETFAFADAFDAAYAIKFDLEKLLNKSIPLLMLTDSKALFDVITRSKYTTEKRLMIDIAAVRQAYNEKEINNIALIKSEFNPADGLTKLACNEALKQLLETHKISHPVEQYVIEH